MLLAVDVGNTQTHLGAFDGGELVEHWRFATDAEATGDELAARDRRPARRSAASSFDAIDGALRLLGRAAARRPVRGDEPSATSEADCLHRSARA